MMPQRGYLSIRHFNKIYNLGINQTIAQPNKQISFQHSPSIIFLTIIDIGHCSAMLPDWSDQQPAKQRICCPILTIFDNRTTDF